MIRANFLTIIAITLMSVFSCTQSQTFYIKVDRVKNLIEESTVYCKNVPIGEVKDLKFLPSHEILIEIELDKSFAPVRKDTFALVYTDFLGTQGVEVIPSKIRNDLYEANDTIAGVILDKRPTFELDSISEKVFMDSVIIPHIRR